MRINILKITQIIYWNNIYLKLGYSVIKLTQKRDDDEKEFKQQIKDLYQAIVVSNIVLGPEGVNPRESSIQAFKRLYKGNTNIFD